MAAADMAPTAAPLRSEVRYEHFLRPPGDVLVFWPGGHLPVGFVCGLPLPGPTVIDADATPLAASTIADASSAMRFFMAIPPVVRTTDCRSRRRGPVYATTEPAYLQPGVVVVWPGGWHLPTCGPEFP